MEDTCTKQGRGPWGIGDVWGLMTVRLKVISRNNKEKSWVPMKRFDSEMRIEL